jgi:hypothetical protein
MTTLHEIDKSDGLAKPKPGFTRGETGFHVEFKNGYGLSVQWSTAHMCSMYHASGDPYYGGPVRTGPFSATAECCETTPSGLSKVHGHCAPDTVLRLINRISRRPTREQALEKRLARINATAERLRRDPRYQHLIK